MPCYAWQSYCYALHWYALLSKLSKAHSIACKAICSIAKEMQRKTNLQWIAIHTSIA